MTKHPLYTVLGFVVWNVAKLVAKRKVKQATSGPALIVGAVVVAGLVAGGATYAASGRSED